MKIDWIGRFFRGLEVIVLIMPYMLIIVAAALAVYFMKV